MKQEDLPKVSKDRFLQICNFNFITRDVKIINRHALVDLYDEWDALKIINLPNISAEDRLFSVLHKEFLPKLLLHEFACRCAEWALSLVDAPDPRSFEVIRFKRRWMAMKATDIELGVARDTALDAARAKERVVLEFAGKSNPVPIAHLEIGCEHLLNILRDLINEWEE